MRDTAPKHGGRGRLAQERCILLASPSQHMVAYGETVAAAKENAVYTPPTEFIDYEGLKEEVYRAPSAEAVSLLTHISGGSPAAKRGERFISRLQAEMDKASRHVRARVSVIVGILANMLREAGKAEPASAELTRLTRVTEDASAQIVELIKYVEICRTACRKATKKFDKVQRTSLSSWLVTQLALQPFSNVSIEPLIVMLSDGFAALRAASSPPKTDAEVESSIFALPSPSPSPSRPTLTSPRRLPRPRQPHRISPPDHRPLRLPPPGPAHRVGAAQRLRAQHHKVLGQEGERAGTDGVRRPHHDLE